MCLRFWSPQWANRGAIYKMCSVFSLFFDSILDFSWVWGGGIRGKVNSAFDRARRVLSWSLLIRFWSPLWANRSGKYANPDPGYPTSFSGISTTSCKKKSSTTKQLQKNAFEESVASRTSDFYNTAINKLASCRQKCVDSNDFYFD